jgi:hypothetical protein
MARHGDEDLMEEQAVEKLLRAALKKYAQLVIAIDTPQLRGPHYQGSHREAEYGG